MFDYQQPDLKGHFGIYGCCFVSETLTHAINGPHASDAQYQLEPAFHHAFQSALAPFFCHPPHIYTCPPP